MKEDIEYWFEVKFKGYEQEEGKNNPAYHLESVMISILETFQECGTIEGFNIKNWKATKEIDKEGKEKTSLH